MSDWIPVNKPSQEFEFEVGMLVEIDDAGDVQQVLIGDVNRYLGTCSCCALSYGSLQVLRYRQVWEKPT